MRAGNFREDLFYRLNVIHLQIPPLSYRIDDIELLTKHFIDKYCKLNNLSQKTLSFSALDKLKKHIWPWNVRELENVIHRATLISQSDEIGELDIYYNTTTYDSPENNPSHQLIANVLGLSIKQLQEKLDLYLKQN